MPRPKRLQHHLRLVESTDYQKFSHATTKAISDHIASAVSGKQNLNISHDDLLEVSKRIDDAKTAGYSDASLDATQQYINNILPKK